MTPERRTLDTIDIPLPGDCRVRLELHRHPDGTPAELVLCMGWSDPDRFDRRESRVLPAETLPELRTALEALERDG